MQNMMLYFVSSARTTSKKDRAVGRSKNLEGSRSSNQTSFEGGVLLLFLSKSGEAIPPPPSSYGSVMGKGQRESHYGLLDVINPVAISLQLFKQ